MGMVRARTEAKAGPILMTVALVRLLKLASKMLLRMTSSKSSLQWVLTMTKMVLATLVTIARQTQKLQRKMTIMMDGPTISMS